MSKQHFLYLIILFFLSCTKEEDPLPQDCAGIAGGNSICGCMDSTAFNYNSDATHDDGSCQVHVDNGDFYLSFNGSNSNVDLGDMIDQGSYTKAAWVKRYYGYAVNNNIISGNTGHALFAPQSQGAKLSAGHNGDYFIVQDTDSIPEGVWTFVAVTYDANVASGTMTLYTNGVQVAQATGVEPPDDSHTTYIGRFGNGKVWWGFIDEAAIWDKALSTSEIAELANTTSDLNATVDRGSYVSSSDLSGYWKMNEGEGDRLSDASGNGNIGIIELATWETCDECGCTDPSACNYDPSATIENRTCAYDDDPCDECVNGEIMGNDHDLDGICDDQDEDDDNDNVTDDVDMDPFDNTVCSDIDGDGCDDCSSGIFDTSNDGPDDDGDGMCNAYLIEGRTVYMVGESYDSEGNFTACYWKDGVRFELPGGAWATDIFVENGTVYTCGTGESTNASYWIDQTRYDLPGLWGEAEAITVHNGDIYVAGWFDGGSCYWKNGVKINLTTNRDSQAFGIAVKNNGDVYVGGYFMNNHHYVIPCFWKNGSRTSLSVPSGGDGEVYDIALLNGNVRYFAGYTMKPDNFAGYTPKAAYWRNSRRTDLPLGGSSWDIYGAIGYGVSLDGTDVYVAGNTDWYGQYDVEPSGGSFPQYWKNNNIVDLPGGPLNSWGTGTGYDVRAKDGNVVVVGVATVESPDPATPEGSYITPCYWLNGELHFLVDQYDVPEEIERWMDGYARGVFIE